MTAKLEPVLDPAAMMRLSQASKEIFGGCNEIVSEVAHALHNLGEMPDLSLEQIYEHLWMNLTAMLSIRAEANGNEHIVDDWRKVIEGK